MDQMMQGIISWVEEFRSYLKCNGKTLKGFEQKVTLIYLLKYP